MSPERTAPGQWPSRHRPVVQGHASRVRSRIFFPFRHDRFTTMDAFVAFLLTDLVGTPA